MFRQWFSKLAPVHQARSEEEKEAVFKFRYQVLEEESPGSMPLREGVEGKRVTDTHDRMPETVLFYTGRSPEVTGTVRMRVWEAGKVPADVAKTYSLGNFPSIHQLRVAEVGRFLIRPSLRGTLLLPSLVGALYRHLLGSEGADLFFTCVPPELVPAYRKLGLRPYGGGLVDAGDGMSVPLIGVPTDLASLKALDSPAYPIAKEAMAEGGRAALDSKFYAPLLEAATQSVNVDPDGVWFALQDGLLGQRRELPLVFSGLSPDSIRYLADHGFILETRDGLVITREGASEREVYVILEGTFEAAIRGFQVGVMFKGDTFGELAFFRQSGQRVATVTSKGAGRLLVLGRSFLDSLTVEQPELASRLLFNLGRLMVERMTPAA